MSAFERFDVIVIGQGYAGLKAAGLSAEKGFRTASFEAECMGGLIVNVNELDPAPPAGSHAGFALASDLGEENAARGVKSLFHSVASIERGENLWLVKTATTTYGAPQVVVASGARLRKLDIVGETEFRGRGVSTCADCDGPMFNGLDAVVVGGGDSAFQEALELSQYASKVTIVMRGEGPSARKEYRDRVDADPKLVVLPNSEVTRIYGSEQGVDGIVVRSNGVSERSLSCSGVFIFIGLAPNTEFLPANVQRDDNSSVITDENCATGLSGLYAIGAVRSGFGGLLTDADVDAKVAISSAARSHSLLNRM